MGLGGEDLPEDGGGGGGEGKAAAAAVSCSICLEVVADDGDRSWAKLQCGHQFHLDCIGSAFNIKGAMQCPNCRKIERGQWLYAGGNRPLPEFNMDDFAAHDDDLYDLSYTEMSFGVHWCPFSGLTRLPSSFDEGDFSATAYHDLVGPHAFFAEHRAISSATPCPYFAFFGPVHPSSSSSTGNVTEGSNFNGHWNNPTVPNEGPTSYAFPGIDVHHHGWEHHSSSFPATSSRIGGGDQPLIPPMRATRVTNADVPRSGSFLHPLVPHSHSSAARVGSSVAASVIPPHPGSLARTRGRVQALQAAYSQQTSISPAMRTPVTSGSRRSSSHRGMPQAGPVVSSSDQPGNFYFIPSGSSGRTSQEVDNPLHNRFHPWDREHSSSFQVGQLDRDSSWGSFHQVNGSDTVTRSNGFRQRNGSDRMPPQSRS